MRRFVVLLVALWQSLPTCGTSCASNSSYSPGFTSTSDIYGVEETDLTLLPEIVLDSNDQVVMEDTINFWRWIFPDSLVFNCSGNLSGWIFRGEVVSDVSTISNLPLLQVYYESTTVIGRRFEKRPGSEAVPSVRAKNMEGVYEYTLPSPVEVQAGDIVVIQYQDFPSGDVDFLQMAFTFTSDNSSTAVSIRDNNPPSNFLVITGSTTIFQQEDFIFVPLITALMVVPEGTSTLVMPSSSTSVSLSGPPNVSPSGTTSTIVNTLPVLVPSSPSPVPSVTTEPPPLIVIPPSDRSLGLVLGVGVAVGLVVALVVVAIVIVAMLLVCKVKKHRQVSIASAGEFSVPLDNPTYREGAGRNLPKKSDGVYNQPYMESNLDAVPRGNGHSLQNGFTSINVEAETSTADQARNSTPDVRNLQVSDHGQSNELSSSVVYHEVQLMKPQGQGGQYYNIPAPPGASGSRTSASQNYSLPSEGDRPQDYAVPQIQSSSGGKDQDYYTIPEDTGRSSRSSNGRSHNYSVPDSYSTVSILREGAQDYATIGDPTTRDHSAAPGLHAPPQDYSVPSDLRKWTRAGHASPISLSDPQDYSVPDPEDYSEPVTLGKKVPSQYEEPAVSLGQHSNQRSVTSSPAGGSTSLEVGLYVPTERERELYLRPPGSTVPSPVRVDEAVYSGIAELQQQEYQVSPSQDPFFVEEDIYWVPASNRRALYDQLATRKYREILRSHIRIIRYLGSGQFGTVNLGCWQRKKKTSESREVESVEVAVKMLKPQSTEEGKVKFLQEAAIMGQFVHPHVVKLHGVVTMGEPVMIVLEYMEKGDLRKYLRNKENQRDISISDLPHQLLNFCREIASGMAYLSSKSFVHRDLAARNILLSEQYTCKIGDFGMSRDLVDSDYYITHGGQIPVRWTAPEALNFRKYSTASDVWSYGTVMYEIWSLGRTPYDGYSNSETMALLSEGFRLPPPPGCSRALYELIIRCWHEETSMRPLFPAIVTMLSHGDRQLLQWSEEDIKQSSVEARTLGAPKDSADELYMDLQNYYRLSHNNNQM